jgi:hypothetical protein
MMVDARRLMYEANQLIDVADIKGSVEKFEGAFVRWDKIFRYYPIVMTEDVGGEVLKAIDRYRKLADEELDERFVLYDFMRFRRAYDADYLDFNVEQTLADWKSKATELGSPEDFFNTPLAAAYRQAAEAKEPSDPAGETPSPGDSKPMKEDQSPNADAPTTNGSAVAPPAGNRPPTLENPGL